MIFIYIYQVQNRKGCIIGAPVKSQDPDIITIGNKSVVKNRYCIGSIRQNIIGNLLAAKMENCQKFTFSHVQTLGAQRDFSLRQIIINFWLYLDL